MIDVGRKIEPREVAKLVRVQPHTNRLLWPVGGYAALVKVIQAGCLDDYLHDWAPRARDRRYVSYDTLLLIAVESSVVSVVSALLERGADPNRGLAIGAPTEYSEEKSDRPLGVSGDSEEVTRLLLAAGADVRQLSNGSSPLSRAATGDPGAIRAMLEAGADPLRRTVFDTPLSSARNSGPKENVRILQEAAFKQISGKRIGSLSCKSGKNPKDPATERGVRTFAKRWLDTPYGWEIVFVKAGLSDTSQALHEFYVGSELHQRPKTAIFDKNRPVFLVELAGMPWTIVFEDIGSKSQGEIMRKSGQALSDSLQCEVVCFGAFEGLHYAQGSLIEEHGEDWEPETIFDQESAKKPGEELLSDNAMCKIEDEQLKVMDAWFAERDIYVPAAFYDSDGAILKLLLRGIKKKYVVGHDVVIVTPADV